MRPRRHRLPVLLLPLALLAVPALAPAAIYKWVDEQGNTHFGNAIPPEYAKQDTRKEEVNERGQTIEVIQEKEPTPEEKAAMERERAEEAARQKAEMEQKQHDRLLLSTYDSVDGLVMARDGKIKSLDGQVKVAEGQVKEREALLERQRQSAAELERSGKPINEKLKKDIATTEEQIARNQARIASLRADQQRIRATYDNDIARYRELKGLPSESKN